MIKVYRRKILLFIYVFILNFVYLVSYNGFIFFFKCFIIVIEIRFLNYFYIFILESLGEVVIGRYREENF